MHQITAPIVKLVDSNKAIAALVAPVVVAGLLAAGNWIVTGAFDATEIRTAAGGVLFGGAAAIGTYFRRPGEAVVEVPARSSIEGSLERASREAPPHA